MSRSGISMRRGRLSRLRYAPPVAAVPTQSDRVLVAFAGTGATPVNRSAGNAMKLPPPATAFMAPASAPAKKRKVASDRLKSFFYHDPGDSSKRTLALGETKDESVGRSEMAAAVRFSPSRPILAPRAFLHSVIPPALSEAEGTGATAPSAVAQWRDRGKSYTSWESRGVS